MYSFPKIEMVKEAELKELLDTHSGAVGIVELLNDKENKVQLFIKKEILQEKYFRFHPGDEHIVIRITTHDLVEKLIPGLYHVLHVF